MHTMASLEISREELIGCWRILAPTGQYIELRNDGTARKKDTGKGTSCDFGFQIFWRHIEPSGLELAYQREGESTPFVVEEFRVKYLKGNSIDWWRIATDGIYVENVMHTEPVCWKRTRPPKSWQPR